jgi:hypothetical protein
VSFEVLELFLSEWLRRWKANTIEKLGFKAVPFLALAGYLVVIIGLFELPVPSVEVVYKGGLKFVKSIITKVWGTSL